MTKPFHKSKRKIKRLGIDIKKYNQIVPTVNNEVRYVGNEWRATGNMQFFWEILFKKNDSNLIFNFSSGENLLISGEDIILMWQGFDTRDFLRIDAFYNKNIGSEEQLVVLLRLKGYV